MISRTLALRPPRRGIHAATFTAAGARILRVDADRPASVLARFGAWACVVTARPFPSLPHEAPLTITLTLDRDAPVSAGLVSDSGFDCPADGALVRGPAGTPVEPGQDGPCSEPPWRTLERLEDLSLGPCPFPRAGPAYFLALDRRTNPALLRRRPGSPASMLIDPAARVLVRRLLARAAGAPPEPMEAPTVAYLSRLQRDLVLETFGPAFPAPLLEAFARFGSGELVLEVARDDARITPRLSNGGPNGAFVFLFAEFALAALELGIDADFWPAALPAMLAAAEHYHECYGLRDGDRHVAIPFADYRDRRQRDILPAPRERILAECARLTDPRDAARRLADLAAQACRL